MPPAMQNTAMAAHWLLEQRWHVSHCVSRMKRLRLEQMCTASTTRARVRLRTLESLVFGGKHADKLVRYANKPLGRFCALLTL